MNNSKKTVVIGGGIIGTAIAYKLSLSKKHTQVILFEKEQKLAEHQSGNNSGVLHCGLYYKTGSLKARLAVNGIREMIAFCKQHDINHDVCGKVVVAADEQEAHTLDKLALNGEKNGLKGLRFLTMEELKKREPNVRCHKALLVPEEGIADYKGVVNRMAQLIKENGGKIFLGNSIKGVVDENGKTYVISEDGKKEQCDVIINCTGLHADRTFKNLANRKSPTKIVPFRGEYLSFKDEYKHMVNDLIYPVPDIKYPFLGVHFTRMINGDREVGPNAVLAFKREGYSNSDFSLNDTFESLSYKGLHMFLKKNFRFAMQEFSSSFKTSSFVKKAQKMMPELNESMLTKGNSGVRAQAMNPSGDLLMDFKVERVNNQVHLLNAPSPGATASLAIADYVINNYIN